MELFMPLNSRGQRTAKTKKNIAKRKSAAAINTKPKPKPKAKPKSAAAMNTKPKAKPKKRG